MRIDRVNIKGTETRSRPDTHVVYLVEVQTKSKVWTVARRFNDFVDLNDALSKAFTLKEGIPPKRIFGSNSPEVIEQRRIGLERYLKSIVFSDNPKLAENKLLYQFLEFEPPTNENVFSDVDEGNWLEQYDVLENLCNVISIHITNHERALQTGQGNPEELMQAKKKIVQLITRLNALGDSLSSNKDTSVTEKELLRRRDLLSKLRIEKENLERRIKNPKVHTENRNELFKNEAGGKGPRVFGKQLETDETRALDESGLIQLQRDTMGVQDQQLDALLITLKRQAQIGTAISDELDYQNKLLDELDADVDRTRSKLKKTGKTLTKVSANA